MGQNTRTFTRKASHNHNTICMPTQQFTPTHNHTQSDTPTYSSRSLVLRSENPESGHLRADVHRRPSIPRRRRQTQQVRGNSAIRVSETGRRHVLPLGSEILRYRQLQRPTVRQREEMLDEALPVRPLPHYHGASVITQSGCEDLCGTRRASVDQHNHWGRPGGRGRGRGRGQAGRRQRAVFGSRWCWWWWSPEVADGADLIGKPPVEVELIDCMFGEIATRLPVWPGGDHPVQHRHISDTPTTTEHPGRHCRRLLALLLLLGGVGCGCGCGCVGVVKEEGGDEHRLLKHTAVVVAQIDDVSERWAVR
mmetsp:Transcript_15489/g.44258  ORF Transcript_15489/g.44258 Transcript_15489/m.44258 type:complete len:308 (+) Transcript_15489:1375-2298(+)